MQKLILERERPIGATALELLIEVERRTFILKTYR